MPIADHLRERDEALRGLEAATARLHEGRGGAVFVVGGAGTGKTTLLEHAADLAGPGVRRVAVRGEAMETGVPFGVLTALAERLGTPFGPPTGDAARRSVQALDALRAQSGAPVLLAVDDLHWSDPDSLRVVAFVARRLADLPVLLVAGVRPWPAAALGVAEGLEAGDRARVLRLASLSRAAAGDLFAERAGPAASADDERRAWKQCAGNPFLTAAAGEAAREGHRPLASAGSRNDAVVARFTGVDEEATAYARAASVVGTSFAPEVAAEVCGADEAGFDAALDSLLGAGLVTDDAERLRFTHPLLAEALYEQLPAAVRRRFHGRAFDALVRRGRRAEAAEHAALSDRVGSAGAAEVLERVGRDALRAGAPAAAVRHLEAAVRFRGDDAAPDLLVGLAEALCAAGRAADGIDVARRALDHPALTWSERVDALQLRGRCTYLAGAGDGGAADLQDAAAVAEAREPARAVLPLLALTSSLWLTAGPAAALPIVVRARVLARGADAELRENAEARWGQIAAESGDPAGIAAGLAIESRLLRSGTGPDLDAAELATPLSRIYPYAHCAQFVERLGDCERALTTARDLVERSGDVGGASMANLFLGNHHLRRGRLSTALEAADRAERYSELTPMTTPVAAALRTLTLAWTGGDGGGVPAPMVEPGAGAPWIVRLWSAFGAGIAALWVRDASASDRFLEVERLVASAGVAEPNHTQWTGHAVQAHLVADRRADAERVAERAARAARGHPGRWPGFAHRIAGARLLEHAGDHAAALSAYRDAIAHLGDVDLPLQRAEARLALGSLLRRTGSPAAGRPPLADALDAAVRCGARPMADAAAGELRLAGGRRRPARDRDLLTAAELRVARAAAAGASNGELAVALHVSTNTVATHLKRVYAKLGIPGRRRLAAADLAAHDRGVGDPV